MATLKEIRKRIASVESTKKITRAMKLVAGARLKRAQDKILSARPYALKLNQVVHQLALHADPDDHPLLGDRPQVKATLIVAITSDRGLCGAFNINVIRKAAIYMRDTLNKVDDVKLALIGKKGHDYFTRLGVSPRYFPDVFHNLDFDRAEQVGDVISKGFVEREFDEVHLVYNQFKSAMSQHTVVQRLLPVVTAMEVSLQGSLDVIYEPSRDELLSQLLPRYINTTIYRALLESWASELGSRMTAMDNATTNAEDLIKALTLQRNRARQAAITKELVEISTGAEALKG